MAQRDKKGACRAPSQEGIGCCSVESIISVDERGQMVLSKEIREKAHIRAGDKLAAITWESEGRVFCISLIKVEDLTGMVKGVLGPLMKDLLKPEKRGDFHETR